MTWRRGAITLDGKARLYTNAEGWRVEHCGHPTAIHPYHATDPAHPGRSVVSWNGLGFASSKACRSAVDGVLAGELIITNDRCGPNTRRILVSAAANWIPREAAEYERAADADYHAHGHQGTLALPGHQVEIPLG